MTNGGHPPQGAHWVRDRSALAGVREQSAIVIPDSLDWGSPADAHRLLRACRRALAETGELWVGWPVGVIPIDEAGWMPCRVDGRPEGSFAETAAEAAAEVAGGARWLFSVEELSLVAYRAGLRPMAEGGERGNLWLRFLRPSRRLSAYPLVSILIPAYKPQHFEIALRSALSQTWENLEILVFDDCPSEEIAGIVARVAASDPRVTYRHNRPGLGGQDNHVALFEACRGELVKFLSDDDVLHPRCVEALIRGLRAVPEATLATSQRQIIDGEGNARPAVAATAYRTAVDAVFVGEAAIDLMVRQKVNFIGEPSTAMFRRADLEWVRPHLLSLKGMRVIGNGDVTLWINLLSQGDLVYLADPLSNFRLHDGQEQAALACIERGEAAWRLNREQGQWMGLYEPTRGSLLVPAELHPGSLLPASEVEMSLSDAILGASAQDSTRRRLSLLRLKAGSHVDLIRGAAAAVKVAPSHPLAYSLLCRAMAKGGNLNLANRLWSQLRGLLSEGGLRSNLRADGQGVISLESGTKIAIFAELGTCRLGIAMSCSMEQVSVVVRAGSTQSVVVLQGANQIRLVQVTLDPGRGADEVEFDGAWPPGTICLRQLQLEPVWGQ